MGHHGFMVPADKDGGVKERESGSADGQSMVLVARCRQALGSGAGAGAGTGTGASAEIAYKAKQSSWLTTKK